MNGVNLIPASRRDARRQRRRVRLWSGACSVYALALAGLCVALHFQGPQPQRAQAAAMTAANGRITELDAAIAREGKRLAQVQSSLEAGKAVSDRPNWSTLLALVATTLDPGTVLNRCRLDPMAAAPTPVGGAAAAASVKPKTVVAPPANAANPAGTTEPVVTPPRQFQLNLGGLARSQGAVTAFVLRLQATGLFEQVDLVKTTREPFLTGEAIAFQIRCTLKERARPTP
ncbi:MAG: PilN domain-containing protein [Planctomycetota bacterium]|nr:PilN domain-containing protein [Planctomycetota bacterium]